MKIVKFIVPIENYRVDDTASFPDSTADALIKQGYADEITSKNSK